MNYYEQFSPEAVKVLRQLKEDLTKEEKQETPDRNKILKLNQQILMKGLELSTGLNYLNYKQYKF